MERGYPKDPFQLIKRLVLCVFHPGSNSLGIYFQRHQREREKVSVRFNNTGLNPVLEARTLEVIAEWNGSFKARVATITGQHHS